MLILSVSTVSGWPSSYSYPLCYIEFDGKLGFKRRSADPWAIKSKSWSLCPNSAGANKVVSLDITYHEEKLEID